MWMTMTLVALALAGAPTKEQVTDSVERLTTCHDLRAPVCLGAAATLTNAGDAALRPTLAALPKMTRPGLVLALSVFAGVESPHSTSALVRVVGDRKLPGFARSIAASTLTARGEPKVTSALIKALGDPDAIVRSSAARSLGNRPHGGDKKVMTALSKAAADVDENVRIEALVGLGMSRDVQAGPALTGALPDPVVAVQRAAADGLRFVIWPASVEPLIESLRARDSLVRKHASEALERQTGRDFGEDYPLWREWYANR